MSKLVLGDDSELPKSWTSTALEDIATLSPKFSDTNVDVTDFVHFVPMASVAEDFGGIDVSQLRPYGDVRKGYTYFAGGDVLFAKITPCMENGKGALVPHLPQKHAFGSTEFHVLRSQGSVQPKWLAHYLSQPDFRRVARQNMSGTAGQLRVPTKWLAAAGIPLAPLAEQIRIVEKLEELLSDLDAGVAELKAAQRKLAQYRQSLLKAAVEGALTADWRAARANTSAPQETGAELLQRILTERRARWETKQLAKFTEQGKTMPKDWQEKYKEPVAPDITDLPALPDGWVWSTLDQLTEFITSGSRGWAPYYADEGATFIRSQDINKDWLDLADTAYVNPPKNSEGARTRVDLGDLLLTITGANVGKAAWVDVELEEAYVSQHVALIRPVKTELCSYLHLYLTAVAGGRGQLNEEAYGAGKPGLNLQQVAAVRVPLPSNVELMRVMEEIATQLDATVKQDEVIEHALKQSAAQRKNILKAAFAGQLVPQDPNDEPASALLERIRAERDNPGTPSAQSRRTNQKKNSLERNA